MAEKVCTWIRLRPGVYQYGCFRHADVISEEDYDTDADLPERCPECRGRIVVKAGEDEPAVLKLREMIKVHGVGPLLIGLAVALDAEADREDRGQVESGVYNHQRGRDLRAVAVKVREASDRYGAESV